MNNNDVLTLVVYKGRIEGPYKTFVCTANIMGGLGADSRLTSSEESGNPYQQWHLNGVEINCYFENDSVSIELKTKTANRRELSELEKKIKERIEAALKKE